MSDLDYTPSMDELREDWEAHQTHNAPWMGGQVAYEKFDRAIAAHDAALRAQIAADIRAAVSRDYDSEADAFFLDGTRYAARIAEGKP